MVAAPAGTLTAKFQQTTGDFEHSTGSGAATVDAAENISTCKEEELAPEDSTSEEMTLNALTSKRRLEDPGASSAAASELALQRLEYHGSKQGKEDAIRHAAARLLGLVKADCHCHP